MKELSTFELPIIYPLLQAALSLYKFPAGILDIDHIMSETHRGVEEKRAVVMADNTDLPKAFLIGTIGESVTYKGKRFTVMIFYVTPEFRSPEMLKNVMESIIFSAQSHGCRVVFGSSMIFKGDANSTDELWKLFGFEPLETVYAKFLK